MQVHLHVFIEKHNTLGHYHDNIYSKFLENQNCAARVLCQCRSVYTAIINLSCRSKISFITIFSNKTPHYIILEQVSTVWKHNGNKNNSEQVRLILRRNLRTTSLGQNLLVLAEMRVGCWQCRYRTFHEIWIKLFCRRRGRSISKF